MRAGVARCDRAGFAEPSLSATADEVRRLIAQAREWAESLGKPVAPWSSDKQDAFVTGIAAEFPTCPIATATTTSSAIWPSRSWRPTATPRSSCAAKVRGLRAIEQAVLARPKAEMRDDLTPDDPRATITATAADLPPAVVDPASGVVLDYRTAVGGIPNDDRGGPWHPPGLRMAEALNEVQESIQRDPGPRKEVCGGATRPLVRMHQGGRGRSQRNGKR